MPNRLPQSVKGELLTSMHRLLLEKVESLGDAAVALREKPEALMAEKAELEQHLEKMLQQEDERQRNMSMTATSEKERIARRELEAAKAEVEQKDSELRRMRIALKAAHEEMQQLSSQRAELQRELNAERNELHKLRQERRVTTASTRIATDAHLSHASPRHMEHPELTSPRQAHRQQLRAASAAADERIGAPFPPGAGGSFSARPASAAMSRPFSMRASAGRVGGGTTGTGVATAARPASAAAAATSYVAATAPAGGLSMARGDASGSLTPSAPHGTSRRPISAGPSPRLAGSSDGGARMGDVAVPPPAHAVDGGRHESERVRELERQNRELERANLRLQTALLAAALDPEGGSELQGLLAAVDRSLAKRGAGPPAGRVSQVVNGGPLPFPSRAEGPPAEKAWPFSKSNLPKGTRLPQGYTMVAETAPGGRPFAQPATMT